MDKYFELTQINSVNLFTFKRSIDQGSIDKVFHHIENESKNWRIIFDLEKVDFINSTFIGYMSHLHDVSIKNNGFLILINCNENVSDIFNLTGILDFVPYFSGLKEALNFIEKSKK